MKGTTQSTKAQNEAYCDGCGRAAGRLVREGWLCHPCGRWQRIGPCPGCGIPIHHSRRMMPVTWCRFDRQTGKPLVPDVLKDSSALRKDGSLSSAPTPERNAS